mgnify:CR=1 FL=1|tara:strand:- start:2862 stop:3095 length:234 start_codon:yes stop_codon:yes gene_type:complete
MSQNHLESGDIGYLNINLTPEEKNKGIGYLGLPIDTPYKVVSVLATETDSEPEIRVVENGTHVSMFKIIPTRYFNKQ